MATKGERTKERILEVAGDLFWKVGYHALNTNRVAAAAGVNKATLYQYFPSKEELAVAATQRNIEHTVAHAFDASFAASEDPLERLRGIYRRIFEMHRCISESGGSNPGCPFVNIGLEMAAESEVIRAAVNQGWTRFGEYYAQIVDDARSQGKLAAGLQTEDATAALVANMNGAMVAAKIQNRPEAILDGMKRAERVVTG